jgi:hypothetical protein
MPALTDDAQVIASEIVTNALAAVLPTTAGLTILYAIHALTPSQLRISVWDVCAMRRPDVFPVQPGGTWRNVSGSDGLPESERCRGQ